MDLTRIGALHVIVATQAALPGVPVRLLSPGMAERIARELAELPAARWVALEGFRTDPMSEGNRDATARGMAVLRESLPEMVVRVVTDGSWATSPKGRSAVSEWLLSILVRN